MTTHEKFELIAEKYADSPLHEIYIQVIRKTFIVFSDDSMHVTGPHAEFFRHVKTVCEESKLDFHKFIPDDNTDGFQIFTHLQAIWNYLDIKGLGNYPNYFMNDSNLKVSTRKILAYTLARLITPTFQFHVWLSEPAFTSPLISIESGRRVYISGVIGVEDFVEKNLKQHKRLSIVTRALSLAVWLGIPLDSILKETKDNSGLVLHFGNLVIDVNLNGKKRTGSDGIRLGLIWIEKGALVLASDIYKDKEFYSPYDIPIFMNNDSNNKLPLTKEEIDWSEDIVYRLGPFGLKRSKNDTIADLIASFYGFKQKGTFDTLVEYFIACKRADRLYYLYYALDALIAEAPPLQTGGIQ